MLLAAFCFSFCLLPTAFCLMEFAIIVALFGILTLGVLFFIARRALRLMVRLALVCVLVLLLLAGGLVWWYGSDNTRTSKPYGGSPSGTRRATSR